MAHGSQGPQTTIAETRSSDTCFGHHPAERGIACCHFVGYLVTCVTPQSGDHEFSTGREKKRCCPLYGDS
ncbi:hypothetical protein [Desulfolithobacter dissulfuricans]|uniref:hypothetical protein n=1 Tax=Desulfolithobacter dissulfuricans TaxID=2795293 RepID=UPI002277BB97|nr:hypothetical protein [Desulfolithobacter dissulfuricans]